MLQITRIKRENVPDVTTYEEAVMICTSAFDASKPFQICLEYMTDLSNTSLTNCILDIMV